MYINSKAKTLASFVCVCHAVIRGFARPRNPVTVLADRPHSLVVNGGLWHGPQHLLCDVWVDSARCLPWNGEMMANLGVG